MKRVIKAESLIDMLGSNWQEKKIQEIAAWLNPYGIDVILEDIADDYVYFKTVQPEYPEVRDSYFSVHYNGYIAERQGNSTNYENFSEERLLNKLLLYRYRAYYENSERWNLKVQEYIENTIYTAERGHDIVSDIKVAHTSIALMSNWRVVVYLDESSYIVIDGVKRTFEWPNHYISAHSAKDNSSSHAYEVFLQDDMSISGLLRLFDSIGFKSDIIAKILPAKKSKSQKPEDIEDSEALNDAIYEEANSIMDSMRDAGYDPVEGAIESVKVTKARGANYYAYVNLQISYAYRDSEEISGYVEAKLRFIYNLRKDVAEIDDSYDFDISYHDL